MCFRNNLFVLYVYAGVERAYMSGRFQFIFLWGMSGRIAPGIVEKNSDVSYSLKCSIRCK